MISFERPLGVPPSETCLDGIRIKSTRLDSGYRHSEFRAGSSTGLDICRLSRLGLSVVLYKGGVSAAPSEAGAQENSAGQDYA